MLRWTFSSTRSITQPINQIDHWVSSAAHHFLVWFIIGQQRSLIYARLKPFTKLRPPSRRSKSLCEPSTSSLAKNIPPIRFPHRYFPAKSRTPRRPMTREGSWPASTSLTTRPRTRITAVKSPKLHVSMCDKGIGIKESPSMHHKARSNGTRFEWSCQPCQASGCADLILFGD